MFRVDGDIDKSLQERENACDRARKELGALRSHRRALNDSRRKELDLLEFQFRTSKEKLHRKLPEHANLKTYRQFLQYYQREYQANNSNTITNSAIPVSTYIIQQETPLISAMHRSFCVLPHQNSRIRKKYQHEIFPYLEKEIEDLNREAEEVSNRWMDRLSDKGEEIDALYERRRAELEMIETEVRKYKVILSQERATVDLAEENGKYIDESSFLSDTEHSDSDDDIASPEEAGAGFLKEALNMFHSSGRSHDEASSSSVHGHINNFFQSFTIKDSCNDTQ